MGKRERAKKFGKEFKDFLVKGNAIMLAVGVVIGGAFQAIVNSLVNDILMPIVGVLTNGIDFSEGFWDLTLMRNKALDPIGVAKTAKDAGRVILTYGTLLTAIINFLIIGFVIFLLVKAISSMDGAAKSVTKRASKKKKPEPPPAAPTTKECPFCITEISIKATRCPNCTSELPVEKSEEEKDEDDNA